MKVDKKASIWKEAKLLFSGWAIVGWLFILFLMNAGYLYISSNNVLMTVLGGAAGAVLFFFAFTVQDRKVKTYQFQLNELLKYATNMSFFLQSAKNPYYSLVETKKTLDHSIQKDIDKTLVILEEEARLDTTHFEKYDFPALNQFHQILNIKYEKGGQARDMFGKVIKSMNFEVSKRDDLYRKKRARAQTVYLIMFMVAMMPVLVRLLTKNLYEQFLSMHLPSSILIFIFYVVMLITLYFAQKRKNDISIRL